MEGSRRPLAVARVLQRQAQPYIGRRVGARDLRYSRVATASRCRPAGRAGTCCKSMGSGRSTVMQGGIRAAQPDRDRRERARLVDSGASGLWGAVAVVASSRAGTRRYNVP